MSNINLYNEAIKLPEYQNIIMLGFKDVSTNVMKTHGTIVFEKSDNRLKYGVYSSGYIRKWNYNQWNVIRKQSKLSSNYYYYSNTLNILHSIMKKVIICMNMKQYALTTFYIDDKTNELCMDWSEVDGYIGITIKNALTKPNPIIISRHRITSLLKIIGQWCYSKNYYISEDKKNMLYENYKILEDEKHILEILNQHVLVIKIAFSNIQPTYEQEGLLDELDYIQTLLKQEEENNVKI